MKLFELSLVPTTQNSFKSENNTKNKKKTTKTVWLSKCPGKYDNDSNNIVLLPVLKLTTISIKKMVSLKQLNAIHRVLKSSLKNDIATGRIIKLATNSRSIHKSQ